MQEMPIVSIDSQITACSINGLVLHTKTVAFGG